MKAAALLLIRAYKRWLSPHKGFSCAYRTHTGRASCSTFGHRAIERTGVMLGLHLLRRRLRRCAAVHENMSSPRHAYRPRSQAGDCDPGCDMPDVDCSGRGSRPCEIADCCSCDWPSGRREKVKVRREARRGSRERA